MGVHFFNIKNSCTNSCLKYRICEILKKNCPVAFALALVIHNDNNTDSDKIIHTDRHFLNKFFGLGGPENGYFR